MSKEPLKIAVAYTRKSSKGSRLDRHGKRQEKQENSLAEQKREIVRLAKEKGFTIAEWYEDDGVSGTLPKAKRPGYRRMLEGAGAVPARAYEAHGVPSTRETLW
jgi:DNA invertase Pin-like site-specific DNA recombinase